MEDLQSTRYVTCLSLVLPSGRDGGINLNFRLSLRYASWTGIEVIPFHPNKGYIFDNEDLNLESRRVKLLGMAIPCRAIKPNPAYPLGLEVETHAKDLLNFGVLRSEEDGLGHLIFDKDVRSLLDSLRLLISANGLYEARFGNLWKNIYVGERKPSLDFTIPVTGFYPAETGPLPSEQYGFTLSVINIYADRIVHIGHGHELRFEDTEAERSKMGIRFIIDRKTLTKEL